MRCTRTYALKRNKNITTGRNLLYVNLWRRIRCYSTNFNNTISQYFKTKFDKIIILGKTAIIIFSRFFLIMFLLPLTNLTRKETKLVLFYTLQNNYPLSSLVKKQSLKSKLWLFFFFSTLSLIVSIKNIKQNIRENIQYSVGLTKH